MNYVAVSLVGLFSGVIGGLFGVGGGIVMVPAMIVLLSLNPKIAIGTSLAVIIPTALVSATTHFTMGNVNWKVALILAPLAIVGGYIGAKLTAPISAENLRRSFGLFMICVGIYMVLKPGGGTRPVTPTVPQVEMKP